MSSIIIVLALFIGWLMYRNHSQKRERMLYESIVTEIFDDSSSSLPRLETGISYGYTSFTLTFKNEDDCNSAQENGLTQRFKERIQQIHSNIKSFNADRAVFFTWEGRIFKIISL